MSAPAFKPPVLTPVQAKVVVELAQGRSITAAAEAAGVHRGTIHKWLKEQKEFSQAVDQARADYAARIADDMHDLSNLALATLRGLLTAPETPAPTLLRAALAILERPRFPEPGWSLPEEPGSPDREQFRQQMALMDLDYKRLLYEARLDATKSDTK